MPQIKDPQSRVTVRRMFLLVFLVAGLGFALRSFVLAPVYVRFASDIMYSTSWWVSILYLLIDGGWMDLAVFALCYPATLYAIWRAGLKDARRIPILYAILTVFKFAVNFIMTSLSDGALPAWSEFVRLELPVILPQIFLELLQYALMILFICLLRKNYIRKRLHAGESDETFGTDVFPFRGVFSRTNPVQRAIFWTAMVLLLGRVFMHFRYQLALYAWYGVTEGWVQMLIDLVFDLAVAAVFYFVSLLLLLRFSERDRTEGTAN